MDLSRSSIWLLQVCHEYVAEQGIELYELVREITCNKSYIFIIISSDKSFSLWLSGGSFARQGEQLSDSGSICTWEEHMKRRIIDSILSIVFISSSDTHYIHIYIRTCITCTYKKNLFGLFMSMKALTLISYLQLKNCVLIMQTIYGLELTFCFSITHKTHYKM